MNVLRLVAIEVFTFLLVFVPRHWRELRVSRADYVSDKWIAERKRSRVI